PASAGALRRLPDVGRHHRLRPLAGGKVAAEGVALGRALRACRDLEQQRRAGVVVPDLGRIDLVPMPALAARQDVVDRGRCRSSVRGAGIAERLAIMPAFRMRREIEQPDHLGGREPRQVAHDRFLRSRISANTFQAGWPASPTDFATSDTSARRNGFAAFSSPMVDGMVGLWAATSLSTSVARAASAELAGSTVLAKRTFACVYSWPQKICV